MSMPHKKSSEEEARFLVYSLHGLLFEDTQLILDSELQILSQVHILSSSKAGIVEQQVFTDTEWRLVLKLLADYPYYCPFAALLQALTGRSLERCQRDVRRA